MTDILKHNTIIFLVMLGFMLGFTLPYSNQTLFFLLFGIGIIVPFAIFFSYTKISIIPFLMTYVILSPFRYFISLHQTFEFPVLLPLDIILLFMVLASLKDIKSILNKKLVFLFLIFYFWGIVEIFNQNSDMITGILGFRNRTMGSILFLIGIIVAKDKINFNKIIKLMIIVLSIVAAYGIIQFFIPTEAQLGVYKQNLNQGNYFMADFSTLRRAFSTLSCPGAFGVAMFFLFFLLQLSQRRGLFKKTSNYIMLLAINLIALLLSGSRSSLLAVIMFLIFELLKKKNIIKIYSTGIAIAIFVIITISYFNTEYVTRYLGILNPFGSESSFVSRINIWLTLKPEIFNTPYGYGNGSTGIEIESKYISSSTVYGQTVLTDNEYVTLLYEQGWIGCLLYVLFIFALCLSFFRNKATNSDSITIIQYTLLFTIAYAVLGIPIQLSQIFPINWFVWLLWGMTYSLTIPYGNNIIQSPLKEDPL